MADLADRTLIPDRSDEPFASSADAEPAGSGQPHRRPGPRRWSLRARLIALVVGVAALALIAVDVMLPIVLRASLIDERDRTLASAVQAVPAGRVTTDSLALATTNNPYLRGEIGWSAAYDPGGTRVVVPVAQDPLANPAIGMEPPVLVPQTVPDVSRPDVRYRTLAIEVQPKQGHRTFLVAWSPLADVSATVRRLVLIELIVTVGLLILLGALAGLIIRRSLRPLEEMAHAADRIAAGDLDARVSESDPDTEVGRLGYAFNGMLDGIGGLLDERTRGEERLRQFIADASHELRTPVAAVQGYTDLYRAGALPDEPAVDRAMDRMGFEAARMRALVDDLLTLTQAGTRDRLARESVDLSELLNGAVDDAAAIDATRTWRLVGTAQPVLVEGDRMRLHQLFANLLANVRTHTPAGTTATVSLLPGPETVGIAVSDDGPGVPAEDLPRLFDRFFRAEKSRSREKGGTGLGLSIVAAIASAHGGHVMADRNSDGGLTITVVLPRAAGTAAIDRRDRRTADI